MKRPASSELRLVAEGLPNKAIADVLQRSINTVENHRERMMHKLRLHEIASLTRYAVSIGLVRDEGHATWGAAQVGRLD